MKLINKLKKENVECVANANIAEHLDKKTLKRLEKDVEHNCQGLLDALAIDTGNDHNTRETAKRMAKMYVHEVFKGRYQEKPRITDFPNAKNLDELYTVGPIEVRSACSHHFVPIMGKVWVGILPSERVIGLSKFSRLVDWVMSRPHIQEEASVMLADEIESLVKPKAVAIVFKAQHMCMTWRGVKEKDTCMVNSVLRGEFYENQALRNEFFDIIKSQGFNNDL